jgi:hypothetical protein
MYMETYSQNNARIETLSWFLFRQGKPSWKLGLSRNAAGSLLKSKTRADHEGCGSVFEVQMLHEGFQLPFVFL